MMKKWLRLLKKDERGLTLVELLAVIVILAIVGAIAFVSISNVIDNSKQDAQIANAQQAISAAKLYEASNGQLEAAISNGADGELSGFIDDVRDPWVNSTEISVTVERLDEKSVDAGELAVKLSNSGECNIYASESALQELDRDELCSKDEQESPVTTPTTPAG